jgi:predicted RND superfamily exporter protein
VTHALAVLIYRSRFLLSAFIVFGAIILAPRANITNIDNELTAWFSRTDPIYQQYERFRDEFGGTRNLIIALQAPDRARLFSRAGFDAIEAISQDIGRVEAVDRVSSLSTATLVDARPSSSPDDDGLLDVRPLHDDLATLGADVVGQRALDDEMLRGDLISDDGTTTAIIVFFDERRIDDVREQVLADIRRIVADRAPPGFEAFFNGSIEISEEYNRITLANQQKFTPPIFLLTMAALYFLFRSWRRTVLTLGAVLVSVIWTLGLYDLLGFTYNVLSSMIVPLVVVLAIADDVHIIQRFDEARRSGTAKDAFIATVSHLFAPILGASGTTALGLASLATSQVVAVSQFGLGAAVGVMVDFVISLILVPTILCWMRPETATAPQEVWFKAPLIRVARFSMRRAGSVLLVALVIAVVAMAGLFRLRVDTNHINFFAADHPLARSAAVIDQKLGGIYTFQILLEGEAESLRQPDALRRMDRLEAGLRELPFVRKVTGLPDYVKRVHGQLGDERTPAIPDAADVIAQELFVFSLADAGRVELERIAASDFSKAQITVKLASMSSDTVFAQIGTAEALAGAAFEGTGVTPTVTGSGRLFSTLDHYLVVSQISSFATAFLTVFAVIFLVFRSWRFGLLAIVPNLFPVLAVFGVMGWLGISLNVATIMLASVALGIVDDDTIHFISRYRHETRHGAATSDAIETAMAHEGRASLTTAVINCCAFSVLMMSAYKPTAWFGGLLGLTMVVAFLAEVFILPATITLLPRLFGAERVRAAVGRRRTRSSL